MTRVTELFLRYVLDKSYEDERAFELVCMWDAERTGHDLVDVRVLNEARRSGDKEALKTAQRNYFKKYPRQTNTIVDIWNRLRKLVS